MGGLGSGLRCAGEPGWRWACVRDRGKAVAGLGLGGAAGGRGLGGWVSGEPARAAPRSSVAAAGTRDRALVPEALGGREHTVRSS